MKIENLTEIETELRNLHERLDGPDRYDVRWVAIAVTDPEDHVRYDIRRDHDGHVTVQPQRKPR